MSFVSAGGFGDLLTWLNTFIVEFCSFDFKSYLPQPWVTHSKNSWWSQTLKSSVTRCWLYHLIDTCVLLKFGAGQMHIISQSELHLSFKWTDKLFIQRFQTDDEKCLQIMLTEVGHRLAVLSEAEEMTEARRWGSERLHGTIALMKWRMKSRTAVMSCTE